MHAAPFAVTRFAMFGPKGNLGKKFGFGSSVISELEAADQEVKCCVCDCVVCVCVCVCVGVC